MKHLYVHIPFCRSCCAYCDFASEPVGPHLRAGRVEVYVERLREQLRVQSGAGSHAGLRAEASGWLAPGEVETIYLGGGTPTVLPESLLLPLVSELAGLQAGVAPREFTIEANPGTIDARLLAALVHAGVTRVSLGVQSFAPGLRATLGRRTDQSEIEDALRDLQAAAGGAAGADGARRGLEWNLDLVFGIPGQEWASAAADIDAAVAAGPSHISLYDLTYTPRFAAWVANTAGAAALEAAGAFSEGYLPAAVARLAAAGYHRYEVSNFAVPGHECRHNQSYWRGEDYLGIGASAVSTIGGRRLTEAASVAEYLGGVAPSVEVLGPGTKLWEKAMLGLRTAEGVGEDEVVSVLDTDALERLAAQDVVQRGCGRLRLNPAFLDVSNTVITTLLASPEPSQSE